MDYYASSFYLSVRLESGVRLEHGQRCYRAQDSLTFMHLLDASWDELMREARGARIKKVSVSLNGLIAASDLQAELFAELPDSEMQKRHRAEKMSRALDAINHRFGRDSVSLGIHVISMYISLHRLLGKY